MKQKRFLFRLRWLLGGLAIVLGTAGVIAAIGFVKYRMISAAMEAPPPPENPVTVRLATAQPVTFRRSSVVVGTVLAARSVRLRTELAGVVTEVSMKPGELVEEGSILVRLDARTETAELKSADASLKLASLEYQRAQELRESNSISSRELDVAAANLTQRDAECDRLKVVIDRKTIKAPFKAKVGLFDLHVGQYLDAGTEITSLEGVADYVDIDFAMPAHVAETLVTGAIIKLYPDSAGFAEAAIVAIDARADAVSRSVSARARYRNPPEAVRPNDSVRVRVEYGSPIEAIAVPATAVRRTPAGTSVFVAEKSGEQLRARSRNVLLAGSGDKSMAWIAHGLHEGEQVVAEGSFKLFDGALLAGKSPEKDVESGETTDNAGGREDGPGQ
jgi:membrane fusion protein, multidrug efflux system